MMTSRPRTRIPSRPRLGCDSTLKQSTADSENIPKGYTQAASNK
ncbi:hypothetical protein Tco_0709446, partial [Tanacetum coccineum]